MYGATSGPKTASTVATAMTAADAIPAMPVERSSPAAPRAAGRAGRAGIPIAALTVSSSRVMLTGRRHWALLPSATRGSSAA